MVYVRAPVMELSENMTHQICIRKGSSRDTDIFYIKNDSVRDLNK